MFGNFLNLGVFFHLTKTLVELVPLKIMLNDILSGQGYQKFLLHFVAFFHVASLFSTGVDNKKVGVDNKKALELTNSTVFHRGRQ